MKNNIKNYSKNYNHKLYNNKYALYEREFEEKNDKRASDQLIQSTILGAKEQAFVTEIVNWMRHSAPAKLTTSFVFRLKNINREQLCGMVYGLQFRASEMVENIMLLGPSNDFVRRYFADFPR